MWRKVSKRRFFSSVRRASSGLLDYAQEMIVDELAGALLEEAAQPPRLVYLEDKITHVEVKSIDVPGVVLRPSPDRREWWLERVDGVKVRLP